MAKDKEDHKVRNVAIGAAVAGVAGYVAGILTAPKSGKETRKDIKDKAAQAKSEAEKRLKAMHSELTVLIEKGKKQAVTAKETAKVGLNEALDRAQVAKDKARDMLSALHEGGADDEDLQKAVKDVDDAIEHLRKYLNKHAYNKAKKPKTEEDYAELGHRLENIYLTGYIDKKEMYKMSFLKGLVAGLGGVIGATVGVAILVWILSLLGNIPFIDRAADNVKSNVQTQQQ